MAKMKQTIITNDGQSLMAKLIAGERATFTKVVFSSQVYTEGQLQTLSNIAGIKQESLVSRITRTNASTVQVETSITNSELTTGYYLNTIGLYAKGADGVEILYSVTMAEEADYIPAYNGITSTGIYIKLITTVSNSVNVSVNVDPSAVATIGDYNRMIEKLEYHLESEIPHKYNVDGTKKFIGFEVFGGKPRLIIEEDI